MPFRVTTSLLVSCAILAVTVPGAAPARTCFPVNADVVSLGEENARIYAAHSLDRAIAQQESALKISGRKLAKTEREALSCAPYPNLIGADEWRCTGSARVCATH